MTCTEVHRSDHPPLHRSFNRNINFSPDHTSSTAHTFTSTKPLLNPISRTTFSFTSVLTFDAPLGHEIQRVPAGSRFFLSWGKAASSPAFSVVKNWMKSQGPFSVFNVAAFAGSGPRVLW